MVTALENLVTKSDEIVFKVILEFKLVHLPPLMPSRILVSAYQVSEQLVAGNLKAGFHQFKEKREKEGGLSIL